MRSPDHLQLGRWVLCVPNGGLEVQKLSSGSVLFGTHVRRFVAPKEMFYIDFFYWPVELTLPPIRVSRSLDTFSFPRHKMEGRMPKVSFRRLLTVIGLSFLVLGLGSCSGGGGGGDSAGHRADDHSGILSMRIGDTKPMLPPGTEKVLVTFDQVSVHKNEGVEGEWISLPLLKTPYSIDLFQLAEGKTTSLVPPVELEPGRYTQVRVGVTRATIIIGGVAYSVQIPSENLKTDQAFEFIVTGGGRVDLTVDFDLSQSMMVTGSGNFKLKPVLRLNETKGAATIQGKIGASGFGAWPEATVIVTWDKDNSGGLSPGDEEYTRLQVVKGILSPTEFTIFWVVPNQSYIVQIEVGGAPIYIEPLDIATMQAGTVVSLKNALPI